MSGADKSRRRGSVLSALRRTEKSRGSKSDKGRSSLDEHERLREAAARSTGLHSILPDLGDQDRPRHRPAGLDLRQIARDEAAAKLCGERESVPPLPLPLPTVPLFPCAHSALAAHTQLSGPLLKHQTPNTLARLVRTKPWKSRHAVFCTYALRNCSCAQPHRASVPSCDSATRTLACLHLFAAPTPDALELARLVVTEDSVVFVVEPTLTSDDSRRGPKDLDDRKAVFQVQGISGAPMHPPHDKPKRSLSRRRDSAGANTLKSATSHRPQTVASLGLHPSSSSANLVLGLDDDSRVHAVWFLQCPDADARQRWVSCIKRAVLLQRSANFISFAHVSSTDISMLSHSYSAERAGFGGTIHFTSPRSVTDPLPSADLDVVLAMRAQAHRSTIPYASPPVTPMATTFSPIAHFPPVSPPFVTSPTSPLSPGSEASHMDTISLGFARSQTPTYAPSVHTTATAPALIPHSKSRSRSLTVTNSAPVQALRGFFSRPPSRGANNRARTTSGTAAAASPTTTGPNHLASFTAVNPTENGAYALGTPISAGLGSMDLSSAASTMAGVIDEPLGTPGPGPSTLPVLSSTGLPAPKPPAIAPMSKGIGSLPPPPRAKRAGSVSHVLARGDETVRGRDEEEGVRRPSLVPMLSLSFGRGDDVDREKASDSNDLDSRVQEDEKERVQGGEKDRARTDERDATQHARILPPMLAPPSSPLPVPPGPGASRSSLQLPGVGVHATGSALALGLHHPTGSALALPPAMANLSPLSLPQPQSVLNSPPTALNLPPSASNLPPITLATSASGPPQAHTHLPTLALRTVGSIPILPGSWPVSPNLTAITPSDGDGVTPSAITPSDVYTGGGNNPSDMYLARGDYQQDVAHGDYHGQVMTPSDYHHHHHHYHAQATTPSAVTPSDTFGMSPSDPLGPYGFSPYRISMTSDAFRISIHSDAYQAAVSSPTSESYHTPPSAVSRSTPSQYSALTTPSVVLGGSYLSLAGRASEDEVALTSVSVGHLPMGSATRLGSTTNAMPFTSTSHLAAAGSTSYLAGSSSHLVTASTSHLATTSTSHLDTSTSHLDLSETTHLPNSTPFTTDADSMYSVKVGQSSSDGRNGSDIFRSGSSHLDATRSNHSDTVRSNNSDAFKSNGRVSLAFGRGALHEYSGTDGWEAGDYHSGKSVRSGVGSARESQSHSQSQSHSVYTQSISVRESPTRTVATGSYRDREGSMRDRDPDSAPSSPSSQAENYVGPTGGLFGTVPRESFGAPREAFGPRRDSFRVRRDSFGAVPSSSFSSSFVVSDDTAHPFPSTSPSQTPVKSTPSPGGRRGHRRAGSYAGPTLYTIASGSFSLDRRQSQRGNSDALPPAAPPPNVPLPPTPSTSRPSTPVSRPRTPSRQITSTPPVPPLPPPRSSLRTRLRMLSTPSTPEPVPRELGPPHEDELAQPISKVPMQMLVQEDSSSIRRAASEHGTPREGLQQHGGMGTSLPPPPRTRPMAIRQHSYSASASDREGSSEGRRSDESGKRGHGARDSAVHLENRGSD